MAASYTAKDILVLEGLEPVRRRPGMYIGGVDATGLHHLLWEIVDNSVDEAMNGHADRITVTLHKDGASVTVTDNGRGIPVDRHAQYKKPALELILTTLHAGGKFEAKNYYHSGGLHGVGASVVTALSRSWSARVKRDGAEWEQTFARGKRDRAAQEGRRRARQRHRPSSSRPTRQIFPKYQLRRRSCIAERARGQGLPARRPHHRVHATRRPAPRRRFHYEDGLKAYLEKIVAEAAARRSAGEIFTIQKQQDDLHLDCALAWTEDTEERVLSFVNSIPTTPAARTRTASSAGS